MIKNIIFDFDGVLADSLDSVIGIYNKVGEDYGFPRLCRDEVRYVGLTGLVRDPRVSLWRLPFFIRKMRQEISKTISRVPLQPAMARVVRELVKNFSLGILTSNTSANVNKFLEANSLESCFSFMLCESSLFAKNESIEALLAERSLSKAESVYIGDEIRDILAMKRIRLPIVAVGWGYESERLLKSHQPDYYAGEPGDLLAIAEAWRPQPLAVTPPSKLCEAGRNNGASNKAVSPASAVAG
ncbi:MAG: HAD-IA family hydrolase [Elusimicrobia bacterium]|nr:HAD-IA family hydrolase [Elusimicrobiota bacterium]